MISNHFAVRAIYMYDRKKTSVQLTRCLTYGSSKLAKILTAYLGIQLAAQRLDGGVELFVFCII